jgi:hypothetical protein
MATYLAANLGPSFAIIVVEVLSWGIAMLASVLLRDCEVLTRLDRLEGAIVPSLIIFEQLLPVDGRGWRLLCGLDAEWR